MLRTKANLALLALAIPVVALTGCGQKAFITVEGEKISKEEFYNRLERVPVQTPQGPKLAGRYVVEQLIGEKLIVQLSQKQGVEPTEEQIEAKIKIINRESGNNLTQLLKSQQMTQEDLKQKIKAEQALVNLISKGVTVSDAEAKSAYDAELKKPESGLKRPEQVKISAIICDKKDKAEQAYKALVGGADFGTVCLQYSTDESVKQTKGELNWLTRNDNRIPQVIRNTAFSLEVDKFSKPFSDGNAWVIVKADSKRQARTTPYEDVKDLIKEQIAMQKAAPKSTFSKDMMDYTSNAAIEVKNDRYKDVPTQIKDQIKKQGTPLELPGSGAATQPAANP